jgi:hypothetical protein
MNVLFEIDKFSLPATDFLALKTGLKATVLSKSISDPREHVELFFLKRDAGFVS